MTLRKSLLVLSLSALLLPMAQATAPASDAVATHARPLLWKVSDADNSVYLLGSFHLLKEADYPVPAEVDRAFDDAEALVFEIAPQAMTSPEALASVREVEKKSRKLSLMELTERTCNWPIGDPATSEFFFCGGKALPGLPYCAHHSRIAYQPANDRRRTQSKPTR